MSTTTSIEQFGKHSDLVDHQQQMWRQAAKGSEPSKHLLVCLQLNMDMGHEIHPDVQYDSKELELLQNWDGLSKKRLLRKMSSNTNGLAFPGPEAHAHPFTPRIGSLDLSLELVHAPLSTSLHSISFAQAIQFGRRSNKLFVLIQQNIGLRGGTLWSLPKNLS